MIKVKINGKAYEAEKGEYILEVCRRNRILVPTFCHHDGLSGLGACRLCVVEICEEKGGGNRVVVSCVYPLSRDCEVFTESEKIKKIRRTILSMLKTRAPAAERLVSLCQIYGVDAAAGERFTPPKKEKGKAKGPGSQSAQEKRLAEACVLCGLCAQACASLGTGAISTVGRGVSKRVSTPYGAPSADCIGCGSCASVCPAKAIECVEGKGHRAIWGRKFKLLRCASCGAAFATEEEYGWAREKGGTAATLPEDDLGAALPALPICAACRKKKSADVFAATFGERHF